MPGIRLTQRRVDALPRRRAVRDVRDTELKGYGVRVAQVKSCYQTPCAASIRAGR